MQWLSEHWATIVTVASLILNALGGAGVVKPLVKPKGTPPADRFN